MPLREIDRPMILPRGLWQMTANAPFGFEYKERRIVSDGGQPPQPIGMIPRRALSRRIEFPAFAFPYLRCLFSNYDIGDTVMGVRNNFAMTISSGIDALTFYGLEGMGVSMVSAVQAKWTPSQRYWYEGELRGVISSLGQSSGTLGVLLGMQLSQKLSATIELIGRGVYHGDTFAKNNTSYAAGVPLGMQYHFNTSWSASVSITPFVDWYDSQRTYRGIARGEVQCQW
jgi:hypothetical protein